MLCRAQAVALVLTVSFGIAVLPQSGFSWHSALAVLALGVVLRDETVAPLAIIGSLVALLGAYLTNRSPRRPEASIVAVEAGR